MHKKTYFWYRKHKIHPVPLNNTNTSTNLLITIQYMHHLSIYKSVFAGSVFVQSTKSFKFVTPFRLIRMYAFA